LRVAFGDSPTGPWRNVSEPFTEKFTEGPSVLKLGDKWIVYYDAYQDGHYGATSTSDFKTFTDVTAQMSFPVGHKHGTALRIPRKLLDELLATAAK
jgi:hypothetical protein